jgi:branched-chain amino acid transport system substrate-binding protein
MPSPCIRPAPPRAVLLLALASLAAACAPDTPEPLRIGATMSLSGAYATQGVPAANGYRLCVDHMNAEGGLLGRPVELVLHDDASDTEEVVALYERLLDVDGVDAILGPYGSTLTEAVAPTTEARGAVHISPLAATSSIWEQGRTHLFMVLPPAELFLAGLVELAHERGLERVAVLAEDALFPRAAAAGAADLAGERGMTVVMDRRYPSGTADFSEILAAVEAAEAEVLAMAASNLSDFVTVTRALRDADVNVRMFGTSGAVQEFQDALGTDAEYAYGLSAWEPGLPYPGADRFAGDFERTFGVPPSFHAAGAYGACQLLAQGARAAGTLEAGPLREALLALETTTVFGPWAVDDRGYQVAATGVFVQWQEGRKVVVWPADLASAEPRYPAPPWADRPTP